MKINEDYANKKEEFFQSQNAHGNGDVNVIELFSAVWRYKYVILFTTLLLMVVSLVLSSQMDKEYTAQALLAPSDKKSNSDLSALTGQFGGIASMAGLNLGQNQVDKSQLALAILTSNDFLIDFINKYDLKKKLFAVASYDPQTRTLKYDPEYFDESNNTWSDEKFGGREPSNQSAAKALKRGIEHEIIRESGLVSLSLHHRSPEIAASWLKLLVSELNARMKSRDILEAEKSISFLEEQLVKNQITEFRSALYGLIEEQTKVLMFADVKDDYVFEIIDTPLVPERPSSPNRILIVGVVTLFGLFLSIFISITRYYYLKHKDISRSI
ncbi:Chain length determinant protein [Pseudidiomarina planktonica]|uniref:Chain length determinant protein n=1 Tax=Pseudidiomarina planktonica TaxID=1323738 RepID=A0A1Y6EGF8_9GAMM|nr:Wzz/FepE/Etk N-terminal domain-containing protein [Pseudidiomarina planktonica]RUO65937.1 LPS O-antigen length regulator [Pseudidiomarina planktonica]SMQ61685.1 Chain length determinant protein [Pseudidiomarina planktonica]